MGLLATNNPGGSERRTEDGTHENASGAADELSAEGAARAAAQDCLRLRGRNDGQFYSGAASEVISGEEKNWGVRRLQNCFTHPWSDEIECPAREEQRYD